WLVARRSGLCMACDTLAPGAEARLYNRCSPAPPARQWGSQGREASPFARGARGERSCKESHVKVIADEAYRMFLEAPGEESWKGIRIKEIRQRPLSPG